MLSPPTGLTPAERTLRARIAGHESWIATADRSARTRPARDAMNQKFLDEANGDPVVAEHLRKAFYTRMAFASAKARRRSREYAQIAEAAEAIAEVDDADA